MKKLVIKYTNKRTGEILYAGSPGGYKGRSWSLVRNIDDACRFYGKGALKAAERRIRRDIDCGFDSQVENFWYFVGKSTVSEIIEIDEEPHWYFELDFAIKELRRDKMLLKSFVRILEKGHPEEKVPLCVCDLWDYNPGGEHNDDGWYYLRMYYEFLKNRKTKKLTVT